MFHSSARTARPAGRMLLFSLLTVLSLVVAGFGQARPAFAEEYPVSGWRGAYFDDPNLTGPADLIRTDAEVNFDWGTGSPAGGIPSDNFSVRWTRTLTFDADKYVFRTTTDDGVRLYVDNDLKINHWADQAATTYTATITLTQGDHKIKMEYYDHTGQALAKLTWKKVASGQWKGEYFNNANLSGSPVLTRNDSQINFDWGTGSPDPSVQADNFSARWTRKLNFAAATYRFTTTTDDGVRLYVDGSLVINKWIDQPATSYSADVNVSAGTHNVQMEYYEHGGGAVAKLAWDKVTSFPDWKGEYFSNTSLSGSPALTRNDASINFDWGAASPGAGIPTDNFSVRWTRSASFNAGTYQFTTTTDDGVRLWVDSTLLIDKWQEQAATTYTAPLALSAGQHAVKMEYFDKTGLAVAKLSWSQAGDSVLVDETSAGFTRSSAAGWNTATGVGNGGSMLYQFNRQTTPDNWGKWTPALPRAGRYQVLVFIPRQHATTRSAKYRVAHNGTSNDVVINQYVYYDVWVSLGTFQFSAGGNEWVYLDNQTGEANTTKQVGYDAVRWDYVGP